MDNELLADEPSYMGQADAALADDGKLDLDEPSIHGMDTSWLNSAFSGFSVVIFGQQLTADKAKKLIYGLAAAVALLFIFWVADVGGGGGSGGAGGRGGGAGSGIAVVIEARFQLKAGSSHSLTGISFQRDFGKSFDETLKADIVAAARSAQPPCSLATADVAVTDMTMVAGAPPSVTAEVTMGDIADAYRCAHVLVTQAANAHSVLDRGHAGSLIDPSVPVEWTIKEETPIVPGSCGPLSCAVPRDSTCQDKIGTRSSSLLGFSGVQCLKAAAQAGTPASAPRARRTAMACARRQAWSTCRAPPTRAERRSVSPQYIYIYIYIFFLFAEKSAKNESDSARSFRRP